MEEDRKKDLYDSFIANLKTGLLDIYYEKKAYEKPGWSKAQVIEIARKVSRSFEGKERDCLNEIFTEKCSGDAQRLLDVFRDDIARMPENKAFDLMEDMLIKKLGRKIPDVLAQSPEYQRYRREKGWSGIISDRYNGAIHSFVACEDLDRHLVKKYGNRESLMEHLLKTVKDSICRVRRLER